jgi:CHAT domain-containing protein
MTTPRLLLGLLLLALTACQVPPPAAFSSRSADAAAGEPAGANARGEACTVAATAAPPLATVPARASAIYCGGWSQPAARAFFLAGGETDPAALERLARGGPWRSWLDTQLQCDQVEPTRLAGGTAAVLLHCIRRRGGWPNVALVVAGRDGPVLVNGLAATLPVVERLITGSTEQPAEGRSAAMEIAVARLAAEAYGAADASRFEQLMALGRDLNQAEKFAAAEDAYRAALAIQQRVLGAENPNTVGPLLSLAINISNQGRDASPLLAAAATMAPLAANPAASARLLHYRGIDRLNQDEPAVAIQLLAAAEAAYLRLLPAAFATGGGAAEGTALLLDTLTQSALLGLAEARRYRGVALARAGQPAAAAAAMRDARRLLRQAGLESGVLVGRNLRSQGGALDDQDAGQAARLHTASAGRFAAAQPGERPEAMTLFLAGARRLRAGDRAAALAQFRAGELLLRRHHLGLPAEVVLPFLDALAAEAAARPSLADGIAAEMFEAAQLARGETSARLVAQAAARLNAGAANPQVGAALRRLQDAELTVRSLLTQRDQNPEGGAALDARIAAAETARAEAETEAAAAAPGYRQLLLAVADKAAVAAVLAPGEAIVTTMIGADHGYGFALRNDGRVHARRLEIGQAGATALVRRIRSAMEVGPEGLHRYDTKAAAELYRLVLAPLEPALGGVQSLLVVADGPLLSIPFNLLLTAPPGETPLQAMPWLVRRHAVVHVPSAETLVNMRANGARGGSAAPLPYAGFGDPQAPSLAQLRRSFPTATCADDAQRAASLPALPGTRTEIKAAMMLAGAPADAVLLGPAFTAAAMRNQRLDQYRVLHFATHALMSGELNCLREPSMLVSTPAGAADAGAAFVAASALLELRLDADLVVLSACNTGTTGGAALGGEGLSALARASFFAGARGVLATHWLLNDAAAARMVTELMRRQGGGDGGSAAALQHAQLDILDRAGGELPANWAHPYFWAPFALLGDGVRAGRRPG